MKKYRILSLDGASAFGAGGYVGVGLLELIRTMLPPKRKAFLDEVDLFAGTSAGGWTALFLAQYEKPSQALEPGKNGEDYPLLEYWKGIVDALGNGETLGRTILALAGQCPALSFASLRDYFIGVFGKKLTLGDLPQHVVVTSFQLDSKEFYCSNKSRTGRTGIEASRLMHPRHWRPRLNCNLRSQELNFPKLFAMNEDEDLHELVADVALRTGACPVMAPIVRGAVTMDGPGHVDGGVYANNPAMCALAIARHVRNRDVAGGRSNGRMDESRPVRRNERSGRQRRTFEIEDILLLSVGNGEVPEFLDPPGFDGFVEWGTVPWLITGGSRPGLMIDMFMRAGEVVVNFQCNAMLRPNFVRFQPVLGGPVQILSGSDISPILNQLATEGISAYRRPTATLAAALREQQELTGNVRLPEDVVRWFNQVGWFSRHTAQARAHGGVAASRRKRKPLRPKA